MTYIYGDKDYKSMHLCCYVEKIDKVKKCAYQSFTLQTIQHNFFQKQIRVTT